RAAAQRYLTDDNSTLVVLLPKTADAAKKPAATVALVKEPVKAGEVQGVPVLVREDHRIPMLYLCAVAKGGMLTETEANNGITQMATELLTRGTTHRSAEPIARETEQLGASLGSFAGRNSFGLQASASWTCSATACCMRRARRRRSGSSASSSSPPSFSSARNRCSSQRKRCGRRCSRNTPIA
ncbi:MAG: hypothetical protein NTY53_17890, partial [Kiritimatiellaeota bacterium]|nr:hypothetical protein [Kiritimatiellota bacterium]